MAANSRPSSSSFSFPVSLSPSPICHFLQPFSGDVTPRRSILPPSLSLSLSLSLSFSLSSSFLSHPLSQDWHDRPSVACRQRHALIQRSQKAPTNLGWAWQYIICLYFEVVWKIYVFRDSLWNWQLKTLSRFACRANQDSESGFEITLGLVSMLWIQWQSQIW